MSVSILWAAFDDTEVERTWVEVPLGNLLAYLVNDEFFLDRLRPTVSKEQVLGNHRCFNVSELAVIEQLAESFGKNITLKGITPEAANTGGVTYESLLILDNRLIDYFTYDTYAERLDNWCTAADAILHGQIDSITSIDVFISEKFRNTIRTATFDSVKKALGTMFGNNQLSGTYQSLLVKSDEDVEYFLEQFRYLTELFGFAEEHSLEVYVETSMEPDFSDFGGGKHNLVTRFKRRFAGIKFPPEWQKFEISEQELHLMQNMGNDTSKYKIKPAEPQEINAAGLLNRISKLLRRKQ